MNWKFDFSPDTSAAGVLVCCIENKFQVKRLNYATQWKGYLHILDDAVQNASLVLRPCELRRGKWV